MKITKGEERERNLDESVYFSESYFELTQLCSLAHQISDIWKLKPKSVIEIGIGNGLVSNFLRRAGIDVTTVDINQNLKPDICCSIDDLKDNLKGKRFDLLVCCEVLEHLPFSKFEESIEIFSEVSDRLYLTLPYYKRSIGIGGFFRLRHSVRKLALYFELDTKKGLPDEHYWEVEYKKEYSKVQLMRIISKYYKDIVRTSKYELNPYHYFIIASKCLSI